jgi:phosphoserine phosphatase RsbU/P
MNSQTNILIVDDNIENIKVISNFIRSEGYKIALAFDGNTALEILEDNKIDLVLLDIMMPKMDGFETCRLIKKSEKHKDIPIIFLSAKIETEDIVNGFKAGGTDYLTKPFKKEELFARMRTHLELNQSRQTIKKQADELYIYNKRIVDSINYARIIQQKMLPNVNILSAKFPESFLIYRPKDILSGDFYWCSEFDTKSCILIADCTGHGVPGAIISVIALTLLNQLPDEFKVANPARIIEYVRQNTNKILHQENLESIDSDEFDMAILIIDKINHQVVFSGLNINLFKISCNSEDSANTICETLCIKEYTNEGAETNIQIITNPGDSFYLYTDGLKDLYDSNMKRKYTAKRVLRLLNDINKLSFSKQEEIIHTEIENWKGNKKQIDDITMIGLKL